MEIKHTQVTLDINNRCDTRVAGIANVNDKKTRYIDVALLASGVAIDLTDCTATAVFVIDDVLINNAVNCTIANNIVTIPLESFNEKSGYLSIEINIKKDGTEIINSPIPIKVQITSSIADNAKVDDKTYGTMAETVKEVTAARGNHNDLSSRLAEIDAGIKNKLDKMPFDSVPALNSPNYVTSGTVYNAILGKADKANVYTKDEVESLLDDYDELVAGRINSKADKATTLAGYGITDAYTTAQTDKYIKNKLDKMPFDSVPTLNSPNYVTSGMIYNSMLGKADKSSFEQGKGNLSCIDDAAKPVIKSASFNYVKNNNAVTITFNIVFNAGTIPQSGFVRFSGLPFKTLNAQQLLSKVVDNKNKEYYCKLYGTWVAFTAIGGASVVADESLVFSATYII